MLPSCDGYQIDPSLYRRLTSNSQSTEFSIFHLQITELIGEVVLPTVQQFLLRLNFSPLLYAGASVSRTRRNARKLTTRQMKLSLVECGCFSNGLGKGNQWFSSMLNSQ